MADLRRRAQIARASLRTKGAPQAFPAGAFYSPIVDTSVLASPGESDRVWPPSPSDPSGIDMRGRDQLALLEDLAAHALPDSETWPDPRYDPSNDQFPPEDAAVLYGMLRHLAPRRMVEVGCGWSTTVTARAITDGDLGTKLTCIEPYPRPFLHRLGQIGELREERVECTPLEVFTELEAGDVLFIDSSHVVKTGSDVSHLFLQVLPRLQDGVVVHVHDIFLPEDYPRGWVLNGFNWNEQYLLQAYLSGNVRTQVLFASHWMSVRHPDALDAAFGADAAAGGSSFWFTMRAGRT